jgi:ferredoxin-NADP reductase
LKAELIKKNNESKDIVSFIFKTATVLKWKAGQYIYYKLPHKDPDNRGIIRHFTISSAPYEENIRLTTKFTKDRGSSFKEALLGLRPGDKIEVFAQEGNLIIEDPGSKYIFIAGGIGITPYRAILLDLAHKRKINDIVLFYGTDRDNIAFKDLLEEVSSKNRGLSIEYVFSPERIDYKLLENKVKDLQDRLLFISGPMMMIKKIRDSLIKGGIEEQKIKADYFSGYDEKQKYGEKKLIVPDTQENLMKCICGQCLTYNQCMKDKIEGLYCVRKDSDCDIEIMGCICGQCPIFTDYKLDKFYYCIPEDI